MNPKDERPAIAIGTNLYKTYSRVVWTVTGETSRSWLVRNDQMGRWQPDVKVPKSRLPDGWMLDRQAWEDWCFASRHLWLIQRALDRATPAQVRAVADLLGWTPPPEGVKHA